MVATLLRQMPLINELNFTNEDNFYLRKYFTIRTFRKKQVVLQEGEPEKYCSLVYKGLVRQYYYGQEGLEINTQFSDAGDISCSALSFFSNQPSTNAVDAVENSILLSIKIRDLEEILSQSNRFSQLAKILFAKLVTALEERERKFLTCKASEKVQLFFKLKPQIALRLPQIYIASYLDLKPETFSKLKKAYLQSAN
jgi:CRP-like cAMP-binding protein